MVELIMMKNCRQKCIELDKVMRELEAQREPILTADKVSSSSRVEDVEHKVLSHERGNVAVTETYTQKNARLRREYEAASNTTSSSTTETPRCNIRIGGIMRASSARVTYLSGVCVVGTFVFFAIQNSQERNVRIEEIAIILAASCGPIVSLLLYRSACFVLSRYITARFTYLWAMLISALLTGGSMVFSLGVIATMYLFYDDIKNVPAKF